MNAASYTVFHAKKPADSNNTVPYFNMAASDFYGSYTFSFVSGSRKRLAEIMRITKVFMFIGDKKG
jgi:hypothetical protein